MAQSINVGGQILSLEEPKVMGILNVNPDSFFSASRHNASKDQDGLLRKAEQMIAEGALILDIGGQSTRPGSDRVQAEIELERVIPAIRTLKAHFPDTVISIDTYYGDVARAAVAEGAAIINDISAWSMDEGMFSAIVDLKVPYILMHMQGRPENMQVAPNYEDVHGEVFHFLSGKLRTLREAGLADVIVDLGFGFGKRLEDNYTLLARMHEFAALGAPLLAGISRKGMIWKLLSIDADEALNGSTVAHTLALLQGACLLRVHDVKAAVEAIKIVRYTQKHACHPLTLRS